MKKWTKEDISNIVNELFKNIDKDTKRVIRGRRGCIVRGSVDLQDFSHCGNNTCPSCNMMKQALEDEIKRINFKLFDNGK